MFSQFTHCVQVFYTVSIITLSVIAVERYLVICRTKRPRHSKTTCIRITAAIWFVSLAFCSPLFHAWVMSPNKYNRMECYNIRWSDRARFIYYSVHAGVVYLLPLCLMVSRDGTRNVSLFIYFSFSFLTPEMISFFLHKDDSYSKLHINFDEHHIPKLWRLTLAERI